MSRPITSGIASVGRVGRGRGSGRADPGGVELLFEDNSSQPFALHLPFNLMERQISSSDMARDVPFLLYSPRGL